VHILCNFWHNYIVSLLFCIQHAILTRKLFKAPKTTSFTLSSLATAAATGYTFQTCWIFMGISQVQVVYFIPFCFHAHWKVTLLLNLWPLIFSLTPFSWLCSWILPRVCKTRGKNDAGSKLCYSLCACSFIQTDISSGFMCLHSTFSRLMTYILVVPHR
jgi:hypothetical protein